VLKSYIMSYFLDATALLVPAHAGSVLYTVATQQEVDANHGWA
jgi:hypothetical protein